MKLVRKSASSVPLDYLRVGDAFLFKDRLWVLAAPGTDNCPLPKVICISAQDEIFDHPEALVEPVRITLIEYQPAN